MEGPLAILSQDDHREREEPIVPATDAGGIFYYKEQRVRCN